MRIYIYNLLLIALLCLLPSCSNSDNIDGSSIFDTSEVQRTEFDNWILNNYTASYNIALKYRFEDIEAPSKYTLSPARIDYSQKLAKVVKFLWLDVYDEVSGPAFTKENAPKVLQFIGSAGYDNRNALVQGTAEGGLKISLFRVNDFELDVNVLNDRYFKTIHHEFAHILHQKKNYDTEFQKISLGDYVLGDWYLSNSTVALSKGFMSSYSRHSPNEDFVEIIAIYVTRGRTYWNDRLEQAGDEGKDKLNKKFAIIKSYLRNSWELDIEELHDVVQRRSSELQLLDLDNL